MSTIPQETFLYIAIVCGVLIIVLIGWIIRLEQKIRSLSRGRNGENIDQVIRSFEKDIATLGTFKMDTEKYLTSVERRLRRSIQGVGHKHFNAFQGLDSGGRQSFATAILDEMGNGVIFSTLHSRDRVNVFAKEITTFNSAVTLTEEEQAALTRAKESCKL
jgi:hypothetical protein